MIKLKDYDEDEFKSFEDLEDYRKGITEECFKDWDEMARIINACYGYSVIKRDDWSIERLNSYAERTNILWTFRNAVVERWVNDNILELIDKRLDGIRCDFDYQLESLVFNIVDGIVTKEDYFESDFVIGMTCFVPQVLIDWITKRQ